MRYGQSQQIKKIPIGFTTLIVPQVMIQSVLLKMIFAAIQELRVFFLLALAHLIDGILNEVLLISPSFFIENLREEDDSWRGLREERNLTELCSVSFTCEHYLI
jgi:hypothetical protein